jgi:hypothetical protein
MHYPILGKPLHPFPNSSRASNVFIAYARSADLLSRAKDRRNSPHIQPGDVVSNSGRRRTKTRRRRRRRRTRRTRTRRRRRRRT